MEGKFFKKFRVNLYPREHIEPEEIFFDSAKIKELEDEKLEAEKFEKPISSFVLSATSILQIAVIVFIAAASAVIVIAKGEEYKIQAEDNSSRATLVFADRGLIYSSDGEILADNEIYFDVFIKSAKFKKYNITRQEILNLSNSISGTLAREPYQIYEKLLSAELNNFSEYEILKGIRDQDIKKVENIIAQYPFFEVREAPRRRYSKDPSLSHVVGYTGEITASDLLFEDYSRGERVGKMGVEAFYDSVLRGESGILVREVDSMGDILGEALAKNPKAGNDVILHINSKLQSRVYEILKRHTKALNIDGGVAILMDPRNGSIVSIVSMPTFDANLFERGISEKDFEKLVNDSNRSLFNRAVGGEYPSGSTIKPIIAAAALEEDIVSPNFMVYSDGAIEVPSVYASDVVYEFKDWKAHGWADMRKAIADSVNVYFYTIGGGYKDQEGLGIRRIEEYLKKFHWGKKLGVDLPGEKDGLIPNPKWKKEQKGENWYIGDTYHVSIGQGDVLVTPLQLAASTAVFANGGTLFAPQIASRVGANTIYPKTISKDFIASGNIAVVREGMRRAVESGSAVFLRDFLHEVAGKTGTAQSGRSRNHAWFTGFAPYNNAEIVVTVLLEGGEKSDYAVRVAKEILEAYFNIYSSFL